MSALEENNQQILLQKLEIRSLKDQIIKILEDRGGQMNGGQNMSGGVEGGVMVGRYGTVPSMRPSGFVGPAG